MTIKPENYNLISVTPITGALGAEIGGIDASKPVDEKTCQELHRAYSDYQVLMFRNQNLTAKAFADFVSRFGTLRPSTYSKPREDHPLVTPLVRRADVPKGRRNHGDEWHVDNSPEECPSGALALYCVQAPPWGGDTMFASLYYAYENLSDDMKAMCERLIVLHSRAGMFGPDGRGGPGKKSLIHPGMEERMDPARIRDMAKETPHPLVCVHPVTGRKFLYVTGSYSVRFQGMAVEESKPLIDYLNAQVARPENTCRLRWTSNALMIADNRCTQHYAVNDYAGFHREMMRIELLGERPFGPAMPKAQVSEAAVA